jgi:hypothetical protein
MKNHEVIGSLRFGRDGCGFARSALWPLTFLSLLLCILAGPAWAVEHPFIEAIESGHVGDKWASIEDYAATASRPVPTIRPVSDVEGRMVQPVALPAVSQHPESKTVAEEEEAKSLNDEKWMGVGEHKTAENKSQAAVAIPVRLAALPSQAIKAVPAKAATSRNQPVQPAPVPSSADSKPAVKAEAGTEGAPVPARAAPETPQKRRYMSLEDDNATIEALRRAIAELGLEKSMVMSADGTVTATVSTAKN